MRTRRRILIGAGVVMVAGSSAAFGYWTLNAQSDSGSFSLAQAGSLSSPSNPTATAIGGNTVAVGWSVPAGQLSGAGYQVIRTSGSVVVCDVASAVTSCPDAGLAPGTAYTYSVVSTAGANWLSTPVTASATTLQVTTTSLPAGDVGIPYAFTPTALGGTGSYTWSLGGSILPAGLTLNPFDGTISGTPTATGTRTVLLFVADANGGTLSNPLSITISSAPTVTTTGLPTATDTQVGYSAALASTGGTAPISWSISSGVLPSGLTLNSASGIVAGTVAANATTQTFTVAATDAIGVPGTKSLTIVVNPAPAVTTTGLAPATEGQTGYSQTLAETGGTAPIAWSISSGVLPSGLTLDPSTGVISETVGNTATTQTFTVTATDVNNVSGSKALTIVVNAAPSVTTTGLATATDGQTGYSQTLASAGGTAPITWSISIGVLPSGLTLSPSTGIISGTVGAAATTQTFTVSATDLNALTGTKSLTITVNPAPSITTTALADAAHGALGYSQPLAVAGGTGTITWSVSVGALPAGLTLDTSTGVISGTVAAVATTQTFTVSVTDANNVVGVRVLSINVTFPAGTGPVLLGRANSFAVLAGSGITNTGITTITGDVGSNPTPAETGFTGLTDKVILFGTNHPAADLTTLNAKTDLDAAYLDASTRTPTVLAQGVELGGLTLGPGVYQNGTYGLTGTLTLDGRGDPNAEFIFQAASTLITATASQVLLVNGANPCHVVWQVGSSATFAGGTQFAGDVLAQASITVVSGASFRGRLMARTAAVTMDTNTIDNATC